MAERDERRPGMPGHDDGEARARGARGGEGPADDGRLERGPGGLPGADEPAAASPGPQSYEELGKLGGEARKEQLGHEGYVELGRTAYQKLGPEFYSEIGRKGGETVKQERGPEFYSLIGKKGGEARKRQLMGGRGED